MSENRIECPLCRTGTYPHFGYTGSGVCDHCGAEWTYDETDTLTDSAMRALWEKIPRWIPVTERLPEIGQRTLVRCNGQTFVGTFCSVPYESGEGAHAYWDGDECDTYLNVTHWMPLPEPTEEKR